MSTDTAGGTSRIDQFRKMADGDPNDVVAHFSLGKALLDAGQPADAARALQRVIALDPNISKAYQLLADAQLKTGHQELAVQTLTNGVKVAQRRGDLMPKNEMAQRLKELGAPVPEFGPAAAPAQPVSAGQVHCKRCGKVAGKLEKPPFRGPFGQEIYEQICTGCWREAIGMGTKVINELRLPLSDPQAQKVWDQHIREFLNLG